MPAVFTLKALGLNRQPNQLEVPPGSLTVAKNVNITRQDVIEPRRGFQLYGDSFGSISDVTKQLFSYKLRILRHYSNVLQFDDGSGNFSDFSGSFSEAQTGLRTKSAEMNGNLYLTSSDGIKKISALTAADLTTASNVVVNAGAIPAIDVTGRVNYTYGDQTDFLVQDSAVAYRVVWGYRDNNNNLILGAPSQRIEVYNYLINLLLQDFMVLLGALDNIGRSTSIIDDQDYVDTLKLDISASATELKANMIALAAKIDNDILYADNVASAPLQIASAAISSGICTVTFSSGDPTLYVTSGSQIFLSGFTPGTSGTLDGAQTVASVTSSTITFNTTATGSVSLSTPTIVSNDFRFITQPVEPAIPATDADLVQLQTYMIAFISQLNIEPNAVIPTAALTTYIVPLDVTRSSTVTLDITIPADITSQYFFQIYRSSVFQATNTQVLALDVFPNDELQLVYEAFPTTTELSAGTIEVIDITPDAFLGANLYTNASTGEGILQANNQPPFALDINVFKNSMFFANTHTSHILNISLLGVQSMIADFNNNITPTFTVATTTGFQTYSFIVGNVEIFTIECNAGSTLAASGTADYFDVNSGANQHLYRFWYQIGTATEPAAAGRTLIPILATAVDSDVVIAEKTRDAIAILNSDFTSFNTTNTVTVDCVTEGITTDPVDGTTGFTFTVTQSGTGEDAAANKVLLSTNTSPAIAVQLTAQSLTRVINMNSNSSIYSFYTSGAQEVPGKLTFQSRTLGGLQFFLVTNNSTTGASFSPALSPSVQISSIAIGSPTTNLVTTSTPHGLANLDFIFISGSDSTPVIDGYQQITYVSPTTFRVNTTITVLGTTGGLVPFTTAESSSNNEFPNRVYYSKLSQPEAVPILNFFDVGAKDKAILRIYPLRDSLFVLKQDGLYRISGEAIPFNLGLFDSSAILVAPDSVSSVDNVIYGWTRQGITTITESGTRNLSRPIDVDLLPLASSSFTDFSQATWGIGYESDKSYSVFTLTKTSDINSTQGWKYNTLTNAWTYTDRSAVCGVIHFPDDRMYTGAGDTNFIEQERKNYNRTDFADRQYNVNILPNSLGTNIFLNDITNISVDDVFVQSQPFSIYTFNALLKKIDFVPFISNKNFFSTLNAIPGDNLRSKLVALAQKLDISNLSQTNYSASIANLSGSISAISTGSLVTITTSSVHGLVTGRTVILAATNSDPSINGEFQITVTANNKFTINPGFTVTTVGTSGTWATVSSNFNDLFACYNTIISKLNIDTILAMNNFQHITEFVNEEVLIDSVNKHSKSIIINQLIPYIQGSITVFQSIDCQIQYSPYTFGDDPISPKHIREAQIMFDNLAFTRGTFSFATDLIPAFQDVNFNGDGAGLFGLNGPFGSGFFGGASNSAPIRTYIPRDCQRCRYMVVKFSHSVARDKWAMNGITLTGDILPSSRAYR